MKKAKRKLLDSLAIYVSADDAELDRDGFLEFVADRILCDLQKMRGIRMTPARTKLTKHFWRNCVNRPTIDLALEEEFVEIQHNMEG
jgi:hypothetical protein